VAGVPGRTPLGELTGDPQLAHGIIRPSCRDRAQGQRAQECPKLLPQRSFLDSLGASLRLSSVSTCHRTRACDGVSRRPVSRHFPILAFSKCELRLALGGSSILNGQCRGKPLVSILWKFGCANALAANFLVQRIDTDIDPSVGVGAVREVVNLIRRRLPRLPENVVHASLRNAAVPGRYHPAFRYCRQCAAHGYIVLYQLNDEDRCPIFVQKISRKPRVMEVISLLSIEITLYCRRKITHPAGSSYGYSKAPAAIQRYRA